MSQTLWKKQKKNSKIFPLSQGLFLYSTNLKGMNQVDKSLNATGLTGHVRFFNSVFVFIKTTSAEPSPPSNHSSLHTSI